MKHRESEQTQLRVSRLLNRDSVMLHAEMPSVQTALETLVELQESNGVITNGTAYYKAVCERERAGGTTAIGEGLAIPHACNAGVASLGLAALTLTRGLDWGAADGKLVDMLVCNYVYEHVEDNTQRVMDYRNVFPRNKVFGWDQIGRFRPSQYLLMHSVIYRTQLLRDCDLELPKHTFYVDNIFVYQPLPYVKNIYYLDVDLYRYFIGRADQSVNEKVMVGRVDQQVRVTRLMIDAHDLRRVQTEQPKLGRYMFNYLAMMMAISSIFLVIENTPESLGKRTQLWEYLRTVDSGLYHKMKYRAVSAFTAFPGYQGRRLSVGLYRLARKIYKFN